MPYPAFHSRVRSNYGFVDVRGRPELVGGITESLNSAKFEVFLKRLASTSAPIFSVGCDLGTHCDLSLDKHLREIAGGYLQVVSSWYTNVRPEHWARLFNSVKHHVEQVVATDHWKVNFELAPVQVNLDGYNNLTGSVKIDFFACAPSRKKALNSRERLIEAIDQGLSDDAITSSFEGSGIRPA